MAKTIPQLTDATTVNAADELVIQQGGITKRATGAELAKGLNAINGTVNVKDFGAVGDGVTDDTAAIQAALNSGTSVIFPQGVYSISNQLLLSTNNISISGQGRVEIKQQVYPQHVFAVRANGVRVSGFTFTGVPSKTALSEAVSNRYYGDVLRAKSSAIHAVSSSSMTVDSCSFSNFVNGVYLVGGSDVSWVTNDGQASRMTATTFVLSAVDQRANDYWNGGYIRIITQDGSTAFTRITDYDSATNTITFASLTPITLTASNQWNYILHKGRSKNIAIQRCNFDLIDFGVIGGYVENLRFSDSAADRIEQTQQTNARPHTIYLTGGDNKNVSCSNLLTYSCPNGQAYKLIAVDGLVLSNLSAITSRGCLLVEGCKNVVVDNITSVLAGESGDFRPTACELISSETCQLSNIKLSVADSYTSTAADKRPIILSIASVDDLERGDIGTMLAASPIQSSRIHASGLSVDLGIYTGVVNGAFVEGTASNPVTNSTIQNVHATGSAAVFNAFRLIHASGITVKYPSYSDNALASKTVVLDSNASSCSVVLLDDQKDFTVTNAGANNTVRYMAAYTSGTWTPALVGSTVAGTNTYSAQLGDWIRIGDVVLVTGRITVTAFNSTGNISISGLPFNGDTFNSSSTASFFQSGLLSDYNNVTFASVPALRLANNGTSLQIVYPSTTNVTNATGGQFTNTSHLYFSFAYKCLP